METPWRTNVGRLILMAGSFALAGCSAVTPGSTNSPTAPNTGPATGVYMMAVQMTSVVEYPTTANSTPSNTIVLPPSYSFMGAVSVRTDPSGLLYVPSWGTDLAAAQILVYPANSTSSTAPTRIVDVTSDLTLFAVDSKGMLYVGTAAQGSIPAAVTVYPADGNGPAVPIRTLQLANVLQFTDIAVDTSQNIYIAASIDTGTASWVPVIEVFAPSASGTDSPARTIALAYPANGITVDAARDVYANVVAGNYGVILQEFGPDANGAATPMNTITVAQQTSPPDPFIGGGAVHIDGAGNIFTSMYIDSGSLLGSYVIYEFAPNATGNATPIGQTTLSLENVYTDGFALN